MEEQWIVDRSHLRAVWLEHPDWSKRQLAAAVGRSKGWVKKWMKRIRSCGVEDQQVLQGQSRARQRPVSAWEERVVQKILELRDEPPPKLGRTPGPLTLLYYLRQDPSLRAAEVQLPRSTHTIWRILEAHQRIVPPAARIREPEERPEPGWNGAWTFMMSAVSRLSPMVNNNMWWRS